MAGFWSRLFGSKPAADPAPAETPAAAEPGMEPWLETALQSQPDALMLELEEDAAFLCRIHGDAEPILMQTIPSAEHAAWDARLRALNGQTAGHRMASVWYTMTDYGDRVVVQLYPPDATSEEARKACRTATVKALNARRPPTGLTRKAREEAWNLALRLGVVESWWQAMRELGIELPDPPDRELFVGRAWPRKLAARALATALNAPYVDPEEHESSRDARFALKEKFCREQRVVCVEATETDILLATTDPTSDAVRTAASEACGGRTVRLAVAAAQDIQNRIDKTWLPE